MGEYMDAEDSCIRKTDTASGRTEGLDIVGIAGRTDGRFQGHSAVRRVRKTSVHREAEPCDIRVGSSVSSSDEGNRKRNADYGCGSGNAAEENSDLTGKENRDGTGGLSLLFRVGGLDCPHCSELIVADLLKYPYIEDASCSLMTETLTLNVRKDCSMPRDLTETVRKTVNAFEPDVTVEPLFDISEIFSEEDRDACTADDCDHDSTHASEKANHGSDLKFVLLSAISVFAAGLILFYGFADSIVLRTVSCILLLVSYLLSGFDVICDAVRNIRGSFFSEQMLMTLASLGAVAIGEYPESAAVMIFYQIGEYFQKKAIRRSRDSIKELMEICPETACLETPDGIREIRATEICIGDRVVVRAGEKVPCDGVIVAGHSDFDTSSLTGESAPHFASVGDEVYSGFISQSGVITLEARRRASDSAASDIVRMVENAWEKKSKTENFISVFARYYTPAVVVLAAVTASVPPLLFGSSWSVWIERSLVFLVVSCPCALVLSVPLTYFSGIGLASRLGILFKGSCYLDVMSRVGTVFFDKTGTLTRGSFRLSRILSSETASEEHVLQLACTAEYGSVHPVAKSIVREAEVRGLSPLSADSFSETAGQGISLQIDGRRILAGSDRMFSAEGIAVPEISETGTVVHVAESGRYCGSLVISDEVKPDSQETVKTLRGMGIECIMLTGDKEDTASSVAAKLGMSGYHASLLPEDKVNVLENKLNELRGSGTTVAFVGDGINDAPALAIADVGVSMGALGSDAAIEAADAVIMSDEPLKLVTSIRVARRTRTIVMQNIILALTVKFLLMILGALGIVGMWFAVFGDVGVLILAVLNAMRMLFDRRIDS
jgi:Cd2+/Zn2+-exporting ATPase